MELLCHFLESCQEVQAVIEFLKPQVVILELCSSRVAILTPQNLKRKALDDKLKEKEEREAFQVNIGDFGLAVMKCVMLDLKLQGIRAGGNSDFSDEMGKELSQMSVAAGLRFLNRAALKSLEEFGIEGSMKSPWKRCCYSCPW
ncbi:uncharacterized protein LOC130990167 [Salvia miltiorrhiza]|uniref:uncharacterized protein LOC130990167 n=1 Tax=Salvia miltiorrhiza TaxID=226208 RepID=UPI0025AC7AEA|nr:uncharacterized protein LOC130990167 [Salvia miltiorrhiza]